VALAVGADLDYVRVRDVSGDVLTLAADLAERVLRPGYEVLDRMKGSDLAASTTSRSTPSTRWSRITATS
jgi:isoleucyl-tRNA synthetase